MVMVESSNDTKEETAESKSPSTPDSRQPWSLCSPVTSSVGPVHKEAQHTHHKRTSEYFTPASTGIAKDVPAEKCLICHS